MSAASGGGQRINIRDADERRLGARCATDEPSHDPLTGLPTRELFFERAEQALASRGGSSTAIFSIDLDQFHCVNDEHGHRRGDEVLVIVADRLRTSLREYDSVARNATAITRVGGDEFLAMCESVPDESAATAIATRLLDAVARPIELDSGRVLLTATIGIAMSASDSEPQEMIVDAEAAQRHAKGQGGRGPQFFSAEHRERGASASAVVEALHHAVAAGEFRLLYQPKISLASDRIVGVEALLRWQHPRDGLILPGEFIPAAELSGVVVPIGAWVLKEAFRQAAVWYHAYPKTPIQIAVNISARQFRTGLARIIRAAVDEAGISAGTVCLEMTETTIMHDIDSTVRILNELKELGFTISVDDFGTGYSSLGHLKELPIDKIKIDRSFVHDLPTNRDSAAITRAIIQMGRNLGLLVIAEGVETQAQRAFLAEHGCDELQGLLISAPLPQHEFEAWVRRHRAR
jgi:diguanylate cyclase (GGDEF)-like protein